MASYMALARKWRPAQFHDIVGQDPIVRTLMNAIRLQRLHQAYLFAGSRGIGKTSIARIFSKAIRCPHLLDLPEQGLVSCDDCSSCKEIGTSTSFDVIEIDGASNNGVEAVREIRENVKFLPSSGTRKIYIIDEVHMLTTAAFNALLKTLEEPPEHVLFIFATTESHKIPATILSRCQRFDFRRVSDKQIHSRLTRVAEAESIQADPAALNLIARASEGSMRDALSLLDQVIAYSGDQLTVESVIDGVGLIRTDTVFQILNGILSRQPHAATQGIQAAFEAGHDLKLLLRSLIEALHEVILYKATGHCSAQSYFSSSEREVLQNGATLRPLEELETIFQILHYGMEHLARSPQPSITLDILAIKCAMAEGFVQVGTLAATAPPQPLPTTRPNPPAVVAVAATPPPPAVAPKADIPREKTWEGFIAYTQKQRPLLASLLEHAVEQELPLHQMELRIFFKTQDQYKLDQLKSKIYFQQVLLLADAFFEKTCRLEFVVKDSDQVSVAERKVKAQEARQRAAQTEVENHPIIREAQSLFGGDLGPIEWSSSSHQESANV